VVNSGHRPRLDYDSRWHWRLLTGRAAGLLLGHEEKAPGSHSNPGPSEGLTSEKDRGRARPVSRDSPAHESNASAQRRVPGK
jgi:hypothetical protein